jgi:hypothetical protein
MTTDALDPGPDGDYPHLPRTADGYLDASRWPMGTRVVPSRTDADGKPVVVDVETRLPDGRRALDVVPMPPTE